MTRGSGNDTLFDAVVSDRFISAYFPSGGSSPPGQAVQPKVLLAHWEADAPGTIDTDNTLGIPVVTAWRDKINGYTLKANTITQAPFWVIQSNMASKRPVLSFDGLDDYLESLELSSLLNNLSGVSVSLLVSNSKPVVNTVERMVWIESGLATIPRFGYARSGIGSDEFYSDGVTKDSDAYIPITGSVYPYDGYATHTVRRDYLSGTERVDFNGGLKAFGSSIVSQNYSDSTPSIRLRIGMEDGGRNPSQMALYGIKLYTYAISDDDMTADAAYFGGLINA
jgi:hypothetical protein